MKPAKLLAFKRSIAGPLNTPCTQDAYTAVAPDVYKRQGYVLQESYGDIHLTDAGRDLAKSIYLRHETISGFLQDVLGVSAENADEDACHIEHVISEETFQKLMDFKNKYAK